MKEAKEAKSVGDEGGEVRGRQNARRRKATRCEGDRQDKDKEEEEMR